MIYMCVLLGCSEQLSWQLQAEKAIENSDYLYAQQILEKKLVEEPENQEVHYYLGQVYRLQMFDDGSQINAVDPSLAEKATNHFVNCIKISPEYTGKKFILGFNKRGNR